MNPHITEIIAALRSVVGPNLAVLHEPYFGGQEEAYVSECITTGWVSSVGKFVDRFEEMLQEITGARRAIAVSNGTSALFVALQLAGVQPGNEVLIPALTFVATANAVAHCHAIPHLVDIETRTLGIDSKKLDAYLTATTTQQSGKTINRKTGRPITALVPMHCFGHPCQIGSIVELAERYHLKIVEDAAESLGSYLEGQHTGTHGKLGILSFNGNKIVTTGGGGAILTNDDELGAAAKHLTTTAKVPHGWRFFHDQVGYNFRMPNLNAALGCAQLEQLDSFLTIKRQLAARYREAFRSLDSVEFLDEPSGCTSNFWLNAILLDSSLAPLRDDLLDQTNAAKLMTRPAWELMNRLPMYDACPRMDLEQAESIQSRLINIPSGVGVGLQNDESND